MEKKKQYRFSIALNSKLPKHIAVAKILNDIGRGGISQLIVDAVWEYHHLDALKLNIPETEQTDRLNEDDIRNLVSSLDMFME